METQTIQVVFDCSVKGLEGKLKTPTVRLVEQVLEEAGLEGLWTLRHSRRIRKRGRGRFGTLKLESRGGAKSLRIWCKPRGNDTGFEYSLCPPSESVLEMAFRVLSRVNPVTLAVQESSDLPGAVFGHLTDAPPPRDIRPPLRCVEVPENGRKEEEPVVEAPETAPAEPARAALLALRADMSMGDQEVADRALMAISFVAQNGTARKAVASESIIEHLGIRDFAESQEGDYRSVKGSMRALTMSLWKRWRYIDRVRCSARRGRGVSDAIKAYRITEKGQRRLESIAPGFSAETRAMMSPLWRRSDEPRAGVPESLTSGETAAVVAPVGSMDIAEIKRMASMHDEAEKQIREIDSVMEATDSEIRLLKIELEGLDSVESERRKKIRELEDDLVRVSAKRSEVQEEIRKKEQERSEWENAKAPHERERIRVERMMGLSQRQE